MNKRSDYFNPSFWQKFTGCKMSIQGTEDGRRRLEKGYVVDADFREGQVSLMFSSELNVKGESVLRNLVQSSVVEENGSIWIYSVGKYTIFLAKPENNENDGLDQNNGMDSIQLKLYRGRSSWNSRFEKIFFFRHGKYETLPGDNEPCLTIESRKKTQELAIQIGELIGDAKPGIIASVARRSLEGAFLMANYFQTNYWSDKCIGDKHGNSYESNKFLDLVFKLQTNYPAVIISGHGPCCDALPRFFMKEVFSEELVEKAQFKEFGLLDCWYLDLKTGKFVKVEN